MKITRPGLIDAKWDISKGKYLHSDIVDKEYSIY